MESFSGSYFDGESPQRQDVVIALREDGLSLSRPDGAAVAFWPFPAVERIDDEDEGDKTRLARGAARLRVDDARFAAMLRQAAPRLSRRSRGHRLLRSLAVIALAGGLGLLGYLLVPQLDAPLAAALPASWEARLGARTVEMMGGRRCTRRDGEAALQRLVARLTDGAPLPTPLSVEVSDRPDINAFTAPGGRLVLFNGLLQAAESADEVAGVLAHEITHSRHRHPTRMAIRRSGTAFFEQLLLGTDMGGMAEMLVLLSYTREFEREADAGAIELLTKAEVDTAPFAEFFARLVRQRRGAALPGILVTHPPPEERGALVRAHPVVAPRPVLSQDEWQKLKDICAAE